MRRNKTWWKRLTKAERSHLIYLERSDKKYTEYGGGGYLPDDCFECPACGQPEFGIGLCTSCLNYWQKYIDKANMVKR